MARDRRAVSGFQETLVAALVITIATMILLAGIGRAISEDAALRLEENRTAEVEGLVAAVQSCNAFESGILDISRAGAVVNATERAQGTFAGARVAVDLVLDGGPEIELGRRGTCPESVTEVESRSVPVQVRTPEGAVTAGVLCVTVWWD